MLYMPIGRLPVKPCGFIRIRIIWLRGEEFKNLAQYKNAVQKEIKKFRLSYSLHR